jgi:hypothetical protein
MSLTVNADQLTIGDVPDSAPCLFIESHDSGFDSQLVRLPTCPVIAIGDRSGVAARHADAVAIDAKDAGRMLENISANPATAQVIVELLRLLEHLPCAEGLAAESMAYGLLQGSDEHHAWLARNRVEGADTEAGDIRTTRDGDRMDVLLDRASHDNAIDRAMRDGLAEAFQLAALDDTILKVSLRGAGRSFSLGADIAEFGTTRDPAIAHHIRRQTLPAIWALQCSDKLETHVQGACVGAGLEIAAISQRLTANKRAWFQLPELHMGLLPGAGGCVSLSRRIGRQRTAELIFSAKRLSAREALEWGLIDGIVD